MNLNILTTSRRHPLFRFWQSGLLSTALRRTFRLAFPLMLGELSSIGMGLAGTLMIGHLGETAMAAFGVASVVFVLSMLLIWGGVRMIPTPVAEAHELRDGPRVRTLVLAGGCLSIFFLLVAAPVLWLGIHYFHVLGQDPEVSILAIEYLKIVVYSLPGLILFAVLVNFADAFSYVRLTMLVSFGGLLLDIFLNWIFIFGKMGMPALGLSAIAINTGITHVVMSVVMMGVMWRKKALAYVWGSSVRWSAIWAQTRSFIRYGVPSALQIMVEFAAFGAGTVIIGQISKTEQAAHQIAINLISVTYVTIMGVSTAGMIRVGQALAYKSPVRVWMAGVATMLLSVLIMLLPTALFIFFPETIVSGYMQDSEVVRIAATLVFLAGFFQLADALQLASISMLRALNDVNQPTIISFLAFWVVGLPLGYYLAVPMGWNAKGIWVGYLVALILQALLFMRRFFGLLSGVRA